MWNIGLDMHIIIRAELDTTYVTVFYSLQTTLLLSVAATINDCDDCKKGYEERDYWYISYCSKISTYRYCRMNIKIPI